MTIQKLWLSGQDSWSGGQLSSSEVSLIQNFAYASNASAQLIDGDWEIHGDPTEAAIIRFLITHDLYEPEKIQNDLPNSLLIVHAKNDRCHSTSAR